MKFDKAKDANYRELEFLTTINDIEKPKSMSASKVKQVLDKGFYWARTLKVPYLSKDESLVLVNSLNKQFKSKG
ncbi:hypothetical protein LNTAR_16308 [Lentisphaera araneosa HTCC2155]|uniref:Uncharacterized protein n=1 Tax=Lentisphaera araneosa HTCC2155 TaxID=313628 RepID=A6DQ76_9BACT|nr:hypothetical protein [Lentisphaera araneosa]EDM26127.1 hypothetical protein LNTAR_16308 [Lentisphaera araneosa HTCC2155]